VGLVEGHGIGGEVEVVEIFLLLRLFRLEGREGKAAIDVSGLRVAVDMALFILVVLAEKIVIISEKIVQVCKAVTFFFLDDSGRLFVRKIVITDILIVHGIICLLAEVEGAVKVQESIVFT
jgi:hypothetical protein